MKPNCLFSGRAKVPGRKRKHSDSVISIATPNEDEKFLATEKIPAKEGNLVMQTLNLS